MKLFGFEVNIDADKALTTASILLGVGGLIVGNIKTGRQIDEAVEKRLLLLDKKNDESEEN